MPEPLPVRLVFQGEAFSRAAIIHTVRHLAMRAGWMISPDAQHHLIYATYEDPHNVSTSPGDLVILSSPAVQNHLSHGKDPIPLSKDVHNLWFPFKHKEAEKYNQPGWVTSDLLAGTHAIQNLWFERRNRPPTQDGWIRYQEDWWPKCDFDEPFPIVDEWFEHIQRTALEIGWPRTSVQAQGYFLEKPLTIVLTHDVDYLPTRWNRGFPRLVRALARQIMVRHRFGDALQILAKYTRSLLKKNPYDELLNIMEAEGSRGVQSSFQLISDGNHRHDPTYKLTDASLRAELQQLSASGWEICLHGSYSASRSKGQIAAQQKRLEDNSAAPVRGYRQHYLNFHPSQLFSEVEKAGLKYDLSVGYNDRSGPRAGTLYPYQPFNIETNQPHTIWEIPFIVMDTTLATTYRMGSSEVLAHVQHVLNEQRGCAALIWHQEQCGGLLDPGFDQAYFQILDWAIAKDARLVTPGSLIPQLETAWQATVQTNRDI